MTTRNGTENLIIWKIERYLRKIGYSTNTESISFYQFMLFVLSHFAQIHLNKFILFFVGIPNVLPKGTFTVELIEKEREEKKRNNFSD